MSVIPTQEWFEMRDVRKRSLSTAVWIPLAASQTILREKTQRELGFLNEYFAYESFAVPVARKAQADRIDWESADRDYHTPHIIGKRYVPVDSYEYIDGKPFATRLVIKQRISSQDPEEWHLHQDLVVALQLKREGDVWVRPTEGYTEVVRLQRDKKGIPRLLQIRTEHLRDYLCARNMGLSVHSFHIREAVLESKANINWIKNPYEEKKGGERWEGYVGAMNADGSPNGTIVVMQAGRTDVDEEEDIPDLGPPNDDNMTLDSWERKGTDVEKIFPIEGRLWRNEWIAPAQYSVRVRLDKRPGTASFIVDAEGKRETKETLLHGSRWLWFSPQIINTILQQRGTQLKWNSREIGSIYWAPDSFVIFGVNPIGLLNVYTEDIATLPDWQQQIWSGFCVSPNGKVSSELLTVQMRAIAVETQAPEGYLEEVLGKLDRLTQQLLGSALFRPHDDYASILSSVHRFRAVNREGLYALAKDVARLTADSIDAASIQKHVTPPKGEKWGSLKSLEKLLATYVTPEAARSLMTPLSGIYDLRVADAHLPGSTIEDALVRAGITDDLPFVWQGAQLLHTCVGSFYRIAEVLQKAVLGLLPASPETGTPRVKKG